MKPTIFYAILALCLLAVVVGAILATPGEISADPVQRVNQTRSVK